MQANGGSPDWKSIDTVLLDMDGTLLDLGFDIHFWEQLLPRRLADSRRLPLDEARKRMQPIYDATHGTLDWYCVDYWSRALELDIAALKRSARHRIAWLPKAREFLSALRDSGRRVCLVTNAHPEILTIKDAQLGIRRHFDAVYSSHELGAPKEDGAFWPRLAERDGFDRRRTLYVDDSLPVLRAARGHGIGWLYVIRRPANGAPARQVADFPAVDSVHELAAGLSLPPARRRPS